MEKDSHFEWMKEASEKRTHKFTDGECRALRNYLDSLEHGSDAFEVNDLPWPGDTADFVRALRDSCIESIVITERSTGLIESLHAFARAGMKLGELKTVTRQNDLVGTMQATVEPRKLEGIELRMVFPDGN